LLFLGGIIKQLLHRHFQQTGNGVELFVGGDAQLTFQLGVAGGIHIAAGNLDLRDEILLFDAALFAQALDIAADKIAISVFFVSDLHKASPLGFSKIIFPKELDKILFQNYNINNSETE